MRKLRVRLLLPLFVLVALAVPPTPAQEEAKNPCSIWKVECEQQAQAAYDRCRANGDWWWVCYDVYYGAKRDCMNAYGCQAWMD